MYNGWIKTYRQFLNWEWYTTPHMVHVFMTLLLLANHEDKKWKGHIIKRGQLITGRKSLADKTGLSEQQIRTCLYKLKATNEITQKSTNKFSVITISNYQNYQLSENSQPAINQQLTTNKNIRIKENIKDIYIPHQKDENFNKLVGEFVEMRKKIKKPITDNGLKRILNKLKDRHILIASKMLENSLINNWQDVYELKKEVSDALYLEIERTKPKENEDSFTDEQIENNKNKLNEIRNKILNK